MTAEQQHRSPDAITVDVWDTLIRRACHPDEVKLAAARFARLAFNKHIRTELRSDRAIFDCRHQAEIRIGNRTRAEGHDDEYRIDEVWSVAVEAMTVEGAPREQMAAELVRFELAFEERVSYADPGIAETLRSLSAPTDLHILSDFYVRRDDLLALVRKKHPALKFNGGMVSCDERVNKRTGRLFRRFQRAHGVAATQHMHVGDNMKTDVEKPAELGVISKHYAYPPEDAKRARLNREYAARLKGDLSAYWEAIRRAAAEGAPADARRADGRFTFGTEVAPIFVLFTLFAIERAMEAGASRIYYFTREGEVLVKVHKAIAAALGHLTLPQAELLEVSRLATYGASLDEISLRELNRFWTMYPRHSMRTLFASLGVDADAYGSFLSKVKIKLDELLVEPWTDSRFLQLLENTQFTGRLLRALRERRRALLSYLAQKGISEHDSDVFVVDIGWRGTIQDNLARILPQTRWDGVYLALFRYLNAQPLNCHKEGFLFNDNTSQGGERQLSPQAPIEMLFNSSSGSVVGYELEGGVVRSNAPGEDRVHHQFTDMVQEGVIAVTPAIAQLMDGRALTAADLRSFALAEVRKLLAEPPPLFARSYFTLEHNETFGVGGLVKYEAGLARTLVRSGSAKKAWDALLKQPKESGWAKGFLTAHPSARLPLAVSSLLASARDARRAYELAGRVGKELWTHGKRRGFAPVLSQIKDALAARPVPPYREERAVLALVGDTDLQDPQLRDFNMLMKEARASANGPMVVSWLLPDIGLGSGGHMTLLRFVRHFRSLGIVNRIYIQGRSHHKSRTALRTFVEAHYGSLEGVEVYTVSHELYESDILIATHWSTAYEVYRWPHTRFKAYFIQDFEPYFYAKSSLGTFAENTYLMNMYGIHASPWLQLVTSRDYGMRGSFFYLGYEPKTYYPDPLVERDLNRVVVYMRPTTERRGTELLLAALLQVQRRRPQTRISIFGTSTIPDVGLHAEVLGLQNEEQLRRLHSGSAVTLLTSLTNYSLMPIEAMACGSVVVDLDLESMRATFGRDAPLVLARPEPGAMADEILALLDARERLHNLSQRSIAFARQFQWSNAFETVTNALFAEYFGAGSGVSSGKIPKFVRGKGGSQVFVVQNGMRRLVRCMETLSELGGTMEDVVDIDPRRLLQLPSDEVSERRLAAAR